jgi:hypothetical protein
MLVTVQRLYHNLPASSTPHQPVYGYPHPPRSSLMNESLLNRKNAFSYTMHTKSILKEHFWCKAGYSLFEEACYEIYVEGP